MLDISFIRDNAEAVKQNCAHRGRTIDLDALLALDETRRSRQKELDELRAERNSKSKGKPSDEDIKNMRALSERIKKMEEVQRATEEHLTALLQTVPNMTHPEVPVGKDEAENKVLREIGKKPAFSFEPKEHWELGTALGVLEFEKAAEVSGARFAYLKGDLALLEFALIHFVLSVATSKKELKKIIKKEGLDVAPRPFVPVIPPAMMRPEVMQKMGRLEPRDERYHIPSDDLYLIGSAEHTLGPLHMNETLKKEDLPIRYIGFSTAFRREAGSYGKDTKGIFRVHQFDKLEFESFTSPENGEKEQDLLVALQEHFMQKLGIPYRVVFKCTGDMGDPDYREFDIEAWLPGQGKYRETHTADYMTNYQARRLNIKIARENGEKTFAHMNDATAIAVQRTLIAIMENYQEADGRIRVPRALQPYTGKKYIEKR